MHIIREALKSAIAKPQFISFFSHLSPKFGLYLSCMGEKSQHWPWPEMAGKGLEEALNIACKTLSRIEGGFIKTSYQNINWIDWFTIPHLKYEKEPIYLNLPQLHFCFSQQWICIFPACGWFSKTRFWQFEHRPRTCGWRWSPPTPPPFYGWQVPAG